MGRFVTMLLLIAIPLAHTVPGEDWQRIECPSHGNPIERFYVPVTSGDASDRFEDWRALSGSQHARATLSQGQGRTGPADKALSA